MKALVVFAFIFIALIVSSCSAFLPSPSQTSAMSKAEGQKFVLQMIAEKQISAEEGVGLIDVIKKYPDDYRVYIVSYGGRWSTHGVSSLQLQQNHKYWYEVGRQMSN